MIPQLVLEGPHIKLVPLNEDADGAELYEASHGISPEERDRLWRFLFWHPSPDYSSFYSQYLCSLRKSGYYPYCVVDKMSGKKIGVVNYSNYAPEHKRVEIGHLWYAPAFQRTYANTEACLLLLTNAFENRGCDRVEWKCDVLHGKSVAAAKKLGFTSEGVFRKHMIVKNYQRDTAWFSMIIGEWCDRKASLESRLLTSAS
eukprot:ANDGO_03626.mRNA.1 Uncharacterized protein YIR042C